MNEGKSISTEDLITKSASVSGLEVTDDELKLINKYAIKELTAGDVFIFKVAICDNEVDRDFEVFPNEALNKMAELYVGKTIISNHQNKAENQCARIYATEVVKGAGTTKNGEIYSQLVAHCYMVKTNSNEDLITEISAGIKKEVSVGCRMGAATCSICGKDNRKYWCEHYPGKEYEGKLCYFALENPLDAYEVSFVAVPAQPRAGVTKCYGGEKLKSDAKKENETHKDLADLNIKLAKSFIFVKEKLNQTEKRIDVNE